MARLIDDIRRLNRVYPPLTFDERKRGIYEPYLTTLMNLLEDRQMPVILVDNVAEYYFSGTGQENWDLRKDFPNLAPPFGTFWAEYKFPKKIHSDEKGDNDVAALAPNGRNGWLMTVADRDHVTGVDIPDEVKWVICGNQFIDFGFRRDEINGPDGTMFLAVDAQGRIVDAPWMQSFARPGMEELLRGNMSWSHPVFLAISFLHCKNVKLVDNEIPTKLAKSIERKHGYKPTGYKTLVIEPLKQILRREGKSEQHGLAKAMHICRGHFKDYREGKGLFGKYHMLVWHESIVRGTHGKEAPPREIEVKV